MQFALCANVKGCDRDGSGQKDRHINKQRSDPAGLRSASRGMEEDNKTSEKQIGEIGNKMAGRLQLDRQRQLAPPNFRQQFFAGLNGAFRPTMLLRLEAIHIDRQFCRGHNVGEENKFPARQLRAITQIQILRQRVVLPAASLFNARFSPESGRSVEVEKATAARARGLLEHEMAVEKHRLHPGEQGIAAIQMAPARLNHPHFGVGKEIDCLAQQMRWRNKIGIENTYEFSARGSQTSLQGARFEAGAIDSMNQFDIEPALT